VRRPGVVLLRLCAGALLATVGLAPAGLGAGAGRAATSEAAENSLLLLLDASGSMRESAGGGQTRIAAAKAALDDLVGELPETSNVGLRVYGATKDTGCDDTQLVAPVAPLDRGALRRSIAGVTPRGDTPIGASLRAAAKDLEGAPGRTTIVLVSDGEDNCAPPQPCDVARDLAAQGLDLRVEAIGFQVGPAARAQLACIAKVTGGSYLDAPDARALTGQLQALSLRAYRDFVPIGAPITGSADPTAAPEMTPGAWVDELAPGETRSYAVDVTSGERRSHPQRPRWHRVRPWFGEPDGRDLHRLRHGDRRPGGAGRRGRLHPAGCAHPDRPAAVRLRAGGQHPGDPLLPGR